MSDMADRVRSLAAGPSAASRERTEPFSCWRARHDPRVRDALVDEFMPVVCELANRYRQGTEPLNDLVHLAMVGLLNAIDRFEPEVDVPFSSVAAPSIVTELMRHARGPRWALAVRSRTDRGRAAPAPGRYRGSLVAAPPHHRARAVLEGPTGPVSSRHG
jgi:DNA-directed RNA polymerase specialized sigma subunit